jgi:hypothetical protein
MGEERYLSFSDLKLNKGGFVLEFQIEAKLLQCVE